MRHHCGLIVGARLAGLRAQIVGIRVADQVVANSWAISRMVRRILRLVGAADADYINHAVLNSARRFRNGYAIPTEAGMRAVALMTEHEGITLENTYTGKTLAGLAHYINGARWEGEHTLFWHTYGGA